MAKKPPEKRTGTFHWDSKQDLYDYFGENYELDKGAVDKAVEDAMRDFRLRRGQAIQTKELWQKAGMALERKMVKRAGE